MDREETLMLILFLIAASLLAQPNTIQPQQPLETLYFRDGSNNYEYECVALNPSVTTVIARTAAASRPPIPAGLPSVLTNIVDSGTTSTITVVGAHGLAVGHRVTIAGATIDTDLNGTYTVAGVGSSTTFTITTAGVSDATYTAATLTVTTTAPRTNLNVWAILKRYYTTTYVDREIWAQGSTAQNKACASRTGYF